MNHFDDNYGYMPEEGINHNNVMHDDAVHSNTDSQTNYRDMSTRDYMNTIAQQAGSQYTYGGAYGSAQNTQTMWENGSGMAEKADALHDGKPAGKKQRKERKNKNTGRTGSVLRRGVAIVVSAALFGGVAGGVFNVISGDRLDMLKEQQSTIGTETSERTENTEDMGETEINDNHIEGGIIPTVSVESDGSEDGQRLDVSDIAESVMPSIVAINIKAVEEVQNFFGQWQSYEAEGSGSGIIIGQNETELLIVTNHHVVSGAKTVSAVFIDNEVYEAKVKGTDSSNDLAVIAIDMKDISADTLSKIKVAKLGSSDDLKVGQQVVAIGNALGYGQSVTTGIVSAKDRETSLNSTPLIQTDAAINPGNSGGALLNMQGELIGINSSKYMSTDVEGMCYAIPISAVEDIIDNLMNRETRDKVDEEHRGYLGIACGTVSTEASQTYGLPAGVLISEVYKNTGAEKAGLKKNYIITKFDGQTVRSAEELTNLLEYYEIGEEVEVAYMVPQDDSYVEKTTSVVLGRRTDK